MKWWLLFTSLALAAESGLSSVPATDAPGSNTVVRIEIDRGTNRLGTVEVELFDHEKPETVRNFLLYTRSGAYSNMFLHRCVPRFVIQGGGFAVTNPRAALTFSSFLEVTNYGRLTNEFAVGPRLTNRFGTIAMAKVGSDPNSASSQWFFNLNDNSDNLDNQNGGFTVFGRVLESTNSTDGTNVLNHFNTLATSAGVISLSGFPVFNELPVNYTNSTRTPLYTELYHTRVSVRGETNSPGATPPTVAIDQPPSNARFTNQTVFVTGTATDDRAVARVLYQLQGAPAEIAEGTNQWRIGVRPLPGFNTVSVQSVDWDGNRSTNASVTFFYVAQMPLTLQANGSGKIQGVTNGQVLQVGNVYTALAKPAKGYYFEGWSGVVTSSATSVSFRVATNATNVTLSARFTRDFFPVLAGNYQGLIRETNSSAVPGLENTGFITLTLSHNGGFSGRIRQQGGTYSFTGRFSATGSTFLQGTIAGLSRTISLALNTTNELGIITGSVSGSSSSSVEAALERVSATLPKTNAPAAGDYPFDIATPTVAPGPFIPGGHGFGVATITKSGTMKFRGTLGDSTAFTGTARPSRTARWPFYLSLDKGRGTVQGWIAAPTNNLNTLESRLTWMRSINISAPTYPAGFSNQVVLTGLRLTPPPPGQRYLDWVTGLSRIDGANLVLGVTNTVQLNTNNTVSVLEPNSSGVRLDLDLKTGLVGGAFYHPWVGTTNQLRGVIFKPGESIRGQFVDGNQTGSLNIDVAPFLATQSLATVTLESFTAALQEGGLLRFETNADLTLPASFTLPYDTALDANGHSVRLSGAGLSQLFIVPTNQIFWAIGVAFADGLAEGTNGASGPLPQAGADACGAGVLNLGGTVGFTNCVFTNFVVRGGAAGLDTSTNGVLLPGGRALGAAICNRGGRASLQDCILIDTVALAGQGTAWPLTNLLSALPGSAMGGAIYSDGPELTIQGTTFQRSHARGGQPALRPDGSASQAGLVAGGAVAAAAGTLRIASNSYITNFAIAAIAGTNSVGAGPAYGGALFVESNVIAVIQRSIFSGNLAIAGSAPISTNGADALGGAIYSAGTLVLVDSTLEANRAQGGSGNPAGAARGGALASPGFLSITNSTLHHNVAEGGSIADPVPIGAVGGPASGGAVYSIRGSLSVQNSTLAFNRVSSGSEVDGSLTGSVTNGALPGDRLGGAIAAVSNSTSLAQVTIAHNWAGSAALGATNAGLAGGGGIVNLGGAVALRASLLVSNAPANHRGSLTDASYNFSSDDSVALAPNTGVPHTNVNVLLGPLLDNGGPTLTMSLELGSPARDKVPVNSLVSLLDQRSVSRPQPVNGLGDAGAVEAFLTNAAPIFIPPHPASATVRVGTNLTLQGTAVSTNRIVYQWQKDGQNLSIIGVISTNPTLTLLNIQPTNAGNYVLIATNAFGAATSAVATIVVDATPLIFTQPTNLVVSPGTNTSFFVGASPTTGLTYNWYRDVVRVGPNAATLPIINAGPTDRGTYFVVISNAYGVATSQVASLSFNSLALRITNQPSDIVAIEGQNTNFVVGATVSSPVTNAGPIVYQWYFAGAALPGRTANTLFLTNVTSADVGTYHVVVTNAYLSLTSSPALLTLNTSAPPAFTLHPTNGIGRLGSNFTFHAFAIGTSPLGYYWLREGLPIEPPVTGSSLLLTNLQFTNAGSYAAVATNQFGTATSLVAVLTVDAKPRITIEPVDVIVSPGVETNFTVIADGPDLNYAWRRSGQLLSEATNSSVIITNAGPGDRGDYQVIITNTMGAVTSRLASLTFDSNALTILVPPANTAVATGQVASFTVVAGGIPPFAYQWFRGTAPRPGETNATLIIASSAPSDAGSYQVVVTNAYLAVTSAPATLNLVAPTPPAFTLQPTGGVVRFGSNFLFQVAAAGPPPLMISWEQNGVSLPDAAGSALLLTNVQPTNAGSYVAVAANNFGAATSVVAILTVDATPRILVQPLDLVVSPEANTNFTVLADGPDLSYAWLRSGQPVADATNSIYVITNAGPTDRGGYAVTITNLFGAITSHLSSLTFDSNALAILVQPASTLAVTGQVASFTVVAGGRPPFAYQWFLDAFALSDETNSSLVFPSVELTNAGNYRVVITNDYLSVTSLVAVLTIDTNAPAGGGGAGVGSTSSSGRSSELRLSARVEQNRLVIDCKGPPGVECELLRAESVKPNSSGTSSGIHWSPVPSTRAAIPADGMVTWTFPLPTEKQSFYRAITP